jgi:hypothetical protein
MRHRRAEERHDPVAHHLVDGALVAMDRFHHQLEDGIGEVARFLGIAVSEQLHRALEVGEEHRDIAITMRYAHLAPDHLRAAVASLDGILAAPAPADGAMVGLQHKNGTRAPAAVDSTL